MLAGCLGIVMRPYHDMVELTLCQLIIIMTSKLEAREEGMREDQGVFIIKGVLSDLQDIKTYPCEHQY